MPIHYHRGELELGEIMTVESITGSVFTGKVGDIVSYGGFEAVYPEVTGTAHITGQHEFLHRPL